MNAQQENAAFVLQGALLEAELLRQRQALEASIRASDGALDVDLSGLTEVSSQVISLLLCALRCASENACTLRFIGMSRGLYDMARVGGVEVLFPLIHDDH